MKKQHSLHHGHNHNPKQQQHNDQHQQDNNTIMRGHARRDRLYKAFYVARAQIAPSFSLHYVFATSLERRKQFGGHHPAKSLAKEPRLPIPHHDWHQIHDAFARRAAANAGQALDARKYVVGTTWLRMAQLSTIRGCHVTPESRPLDRLAAACLAVHPRLDCEPRGYVFRAVVLMEMETEAVMV